MLIIFVFPLFHFLYRFNVFRVVGLPKSGFKKILYFIYLLLECFEIPLSFLYDSPSHSLFLLHEKGIGEILNPSIIFFPTEHVRSWHSIIINFITSIYFIITPIIYTISQKSLEEDIKELNLLRLTLGFQTAFYVFSIIVNVFCLIGLICIII